MKLPPEDGLLTVDQPPTVNPDFFSDGAGAGPVPGVVVAITEFWVVDRADHRGDGADSFTPAALAVFGNSFSHFRSFSLSIASWELA